MPNKKHLKQREGKSLRDLVAAISPLAARLQDIQKKAKELGIFTNDRELLECPHCGLLEDVACDGRLITYRSGDQTFLDTGLRFQEISSRSFRYPRCKSILKAVSADNRKRAKEKKR